MQDDVVINGVTYSCSKVIAAEIERLRASLSASVDVQMKLGEENEELIRGMTEMAERFNRAMAPHLPQS